MKLAILGAGTVGATLGKAWADKGHSICYGSRKPESGKLKEVVASTGVNASAATLAEAATGADAVVLTTPWEGTREALSLAGDLAGKPVLDATNPLGAGLKIIVGADTSGAELVSQWAPGAHVVKVFNTVGFGIMADPRLADGPAMMLYCGDDAGAKTIARGLAEDLGFDPVDAGGLTQARLLESMAALWISLAFGGLGRDFAFRLVRR